MDTAFHVNIHVAYSDLLHDNFRYEHKMDYAKRYLNLTKRMRRDGMKSPPNTYQELLKLLPILKGYTRDDKNLYLIVYHPFTEDMSVIKDDSTWSEIECDKILSLFTRFYKIPYRYPYYL